ncbi:MAG: Mor transcription activator family protein [Pseudomonadota bacterium]
MAEIVGDEKALALGRLFCGCRVSWPSRAALDRLARNHAIMNEVGKVSVAELARKYGVSRVQVYRIVKGERKAGLDRAKGGSLPAQTRPG